MTINLKQKYITNEILIIRFKKSNSTPKKSEKMIE
jgi:hypothetical protein